MENKELSLKDKLIKIQSELVAPKNQRNTFGNYNYRSCEDILEALKPMLKQYDLVLTLDDELVNIGERYYIKATARLESKGDSIGISAFAREEETKKGMDCSQITGASSSYARKYALNGLFLIDDNKDSDATNTGNGKTEAPKAEEPKQASSEYPSSEKQRKLIYLLYKEKNGQEMPEEEKEKIRKLNSKQASDLISKWKEASQEPKDPFIAEMEEEKKKFVGEEGDTEELSKTLNNMDL